MSREGLEIVGLVPARGGSKGIPGKNLRILGGRNLVALAIESGLQSRLVNRVILSTDSADIAEEGKRAGWPTARGIGQHRQPGGHGPGRVHHVPQGKRFMTHAGGALRPRGTRFP